MLVDGDRVPFLARQVEGRLVAVVEAHARHEAVAREDERVAHRPHRQRRRLPRHLRRPLARRLAQQQGADVPGPQETVGERRLAPFGGEDGVGQAGRAGEHQVVVLVQGVGDAPQRAGVGLEAGEEAARRRESRVAGAPHQVGLSVRRRLDVDPAARRAQQGDERRRVLVFHRRQGRHQAAVVVPEVDREQGHGRRRQGARRRR